MVQLRIIKLYLIGILTCLMEAIKDRSCMVVQRGELLPDSPSDPASVLSSSAHCVEFAHSPCVGGFSLCAPVSSQRLKWRILVESCS